MHFLFRRTQRGAPFLHPLQPVPRTAILLDGFQESRLIRVFPAGWTAETSRFQPAVAAGSMARLRELAARKIELERAVIVFTGLAARLTKGDRDFLWHAFGVPVFEQCLGPGNVLLAAECEAHDGLHVCGEIAGEDPIELEQTLCACGSTAPRLIERPPLTMAALA